MKVKRLPAYITSTKNPGQPEKAYLVGWVSNVALYQCKGGYLIARLTTKPLIEQARTEGTPMGLFRKDGIVYNRENDGPAKEENLEEEEGK